MLFGTKNSIVNSEPWSLCYSRHVYYLWRSSRYRKCAGNRASAQCGIIINVEGIAALCVPRIWLMAWAPFDLGNYPLKFIWWLQRFEWRDTWHEKSEQLFQSQLRFGKWLGVAAAEWIELPTFSITIPCIASIFSPKIMRLQAIVAQYGLITTIETINYRVLSPLWL